MADASRPAALLVAQIRRVFSFLAPCAPSPSALSVRYRIYGHDHLVIRLLRGRRQRIADNRLGFLDDVPQMIRAPEALGIDLVDILGP